MLFHSQEFILLFLPVAVGIYYALARHPSARQWWLIAASLVFYGWWDIRFLPLLIGQTLVTWLIVELAIRKDWRWLLYFAIVANLSVLGLFKYLDFGASILQQVTGREFAKASLILPIGISFYTFELISYLVDRLRGTAPRYGIRVFGLFIVLFPHLIAGPIMRHNEIIPQFAYDPLRRGLYERIGRGLVLFLIGFVEKFFIADQLAPIVDPIFAEAALVVPTFSLAGAGALAFALQIFFDFVAYSNMAMGIGLMCGLMLPVNFNVPYRALNLRDFWRRWHITLSRWLRDYVYIPLGGSREGVAVYIWATLVTMGLCGLWHGAGWTFVLWGLGHGIGLLVCRFWQRYGPPLPANCGLGDHTDLCGPAFRRVSRRRSRDRFAYVRGTDRPRRAWGALACRHPGADRNRGHDRAMQSSDLRACHAAPAELARGDRLRRSVRDLRA
jgi:D-alanyl-lipoteichoic acid acyltransferase DltB (MBOAT superfamily)